MSTTSNPPPQPNQPQDSLLDKGVNKAQEMFTAWYFGPILGDLINLYRYLNKHYPKVMVIAHLVVFALIGGGLLIAHFAEPHKAEQPVGQSPSHTATAPPLPRKENPLPVRVGFRSSNIGEGTVIQLTGNAGTQPLRIHCMLHRLGEPRSVAGATKDAAPDKTLLQLLDESRPKLLNRLLSPDDTTKVLPPYEGDTWLFTTKDLIVQPERMIEIERFELGDHMAKSGYLLSLSSQDYDTYVTVVPPVARGR